MRLVGLIPYEQYHNREPLGAKALSELNTGNPVYSIKENIDGSKEAYYHINLIYLLDELFTKNAFNKTSIEQERFLKRFFYEADKVIKNINKGESDPYKGVSDVMKQLDLFLGNYRGINNGRYSNRI